MDGGQGNNETETCSLDIVQLDSSDDEFLCNDSNDYQLVNYEADLASAIKDNEYGSSRQMDEDEDDIDSEEEQDILKGIRDEIESKVREEMKDELQVYQSNLLAIEAGQLPGIKDDDKQEADDKDTTEMDPKLKEAFIKMEKLDRILKKKVKKEREVKTDRLILEKRMRDEISEMKHGASNYKEIKTNTEKFLALAPPPSHNEGISLDYEEEDIPPLFQTQIDDSEIKRRNRNSPMKGDEERDGDKSSAKTPSDRGHSRSESTTSRDGGKKNKSDKKNFIKRNKELAAAANEVIAMTDDEKTRLHELLGDIDEFPEIDEGSLDDTDSTVFQLALNPGDGFVPNDVESKSLTNIDEKLKHIMPEDEYLSIMSAASSQGPTPRPTLFTRVGVKSTANLLDGFGEQVLYETKEERELKAKLDDIEKKLEMFKAPNETETDRSDCHLTDEQLDDLLNQCACSMSRTSVLDTPDTTARSEVSSREELMENPPKLSDEQLQQLLSQAYFPMSSHLACLKEEEGETGEGVEGIISAETWKAIMNERLGDEEEETSTPENLNISQNANPENDEEFNVPYEYDDLLSGKEAVSDGHKDSSLPARLNSRHRSSSKEFCGLPKISSSSNSSFTGHLTSVTDSLNISRETSSSSIKWEEDAQSSASLLRLPDISSNSFLIHASQGLNNDSMKTRGNLSSKEPIPMVHNNLSDMSVTSFCEDNWDEIQNHERKSSRGIMSPHVPRPPSTSQ